jgi:O-antigen/teichoic acid export membrane protein
MVASGALASWATARWLGPEGRGQVARALVWSTTALSISDLGVSATLAFYAAQIDKCQLTSLCGLAALLAITLGTFSVAILAFVASRVFSDTNSVFQITLAAVSVPFGLFAGNIGFILLAQGKYHKQNSIRIAASVGYPIGIALLVLTTGSLSVHAVLYAQLAAQIASAAVALAYTKTLGGIRLQVLRLPLRSMTGFSVRSFIASLAYQINSRFDQLFLSVTRGSADLGLYAVATAFPSLVAPIHNAVATNTLGQLLSIPRCNRSALRRAALKNLLLAAVLGAPIAILLAPFVPFIVTKAFGHAFMPASTVAIIALLVSPVNGLRIVGNNALRGIGRPGDSIIAEGIGLLCLILLLPLSVHHYGLPGAVCACATAGLFVSAIQLTSLLRRTQSVPIL